MNIHHEPTNGVAPEPSEIDRLRDVIFGGHSRDVERRFRSLERRSDDLEANLARLTERLDQNIIELQSAIRQQQVQLQMRIEDVQRTAQERLVAQQRQNEQRLESVQRSIYEMIELLDRSKMDQQQLGAMLSDLGVRLQRAGDLAAVSPLHSEA